MKQRKTIEPPEIPRKMKVQRYFRGFILKDGAACGMTAAKTAQTYEAAADESG
ncbi:hypothetical protein [Pararhizobium sp. IMCC21322]|uniref:hypothetical protein n=1 Tax=Pararhizobium sp. IMCC21322 TaxID=3067903 RepID=UPI0027420F81|nr:hypothetical protein [Pararhizobium sp. IMCC21322]